MYFINMQSLHMSYCSNFSIMLFVDKIEKQDYVYMLLCVCGCVIERVLNFIFLLRYCGNLDVPFNVK